MQGSEQQTTPTAAKPKRCALLSGSYGLGCGIHDPASGPRALRAAGLVRRLENIGVQVVDYGDEPEPAATAGPGADPRLRHLAQALSFSTRFGPRVERLWHTGAFTLILGGDHSISISSIAYGVKALKERHGAEAELGVLWVDAHGDVNTPETTPSGNIHGMSLAVLLGYGDPHLCAIGGAYPKVKPENVAFLGTRSLDPGERSFIRDHQIQCLTMREVDYYGIGECCRRALDTVSTNTAAFVISFDLDACDPSIAPAVGTSVRAGLTWREAQLILELAAEYDTFAGLELIEYAPQRDLQGSTAELGIALAESALGLRIL